MYIFYVFTLFLALVVNPGDTMIVLYSGRSDNLADRRLNISPHFKSTAKVAVQMHDW